ncbi:MAG: S8 family serine peptidase, partial [Kiritimatiellae bacterium]|nr:S8 family serine peptidase [Kiritimatiellia bacterium]
LVAAAGNDALEGVVYPARYEGVVAVAAVDAMGRHLFFSNRGPEIDIAAPGWDVVAAGKDGGLVSFSGTSAAVPFVAGTIAALLSRESALTTSDAIQILLECADDTGPPGKDAQSGYGILNIARILRRGTTGICDVAVALPYVSPDASPEGLKTVTVYGQNRGTMPLAHTELVAEVAGQEFRRDFYDVGVGAIFVMPLQIPTNLLNRPGGVPITGVARVPGIKDETPENNMVSGVLLGPSS